MVKHGKRFLALLLTAVMVMSLAVSSYAEGPGNDTEEDYRFRTKVSSENADGSSGSVTGTVYGDFSGKLVIDGEKVTSSNALAALWLRNVGSLGISDERHYETAFHFDGEAREVALSSVANLFKPLDKTVVVAKCGDNEMTYTVEMKDADGRLFTLTPDTYEHASGTWHSIVNDTHFEIGTKEEDSYIVLANGASLQTGKTLLKFAEDYTGDLKLDNISDLKALSAEVRKALTLEETDTAYDGVLVKLPMGTELALGSSYAKLKECATVAVEGKIATEELEEILKKLRDTEDGEPVEVMKALFRLLGQVIEVFGGKKTQVDMAFGHEIPAELTWEWAEDHNSATASYQCPICKETVVLEAKVSKKETPASCEEDGKTVYTAEVEIDGKTYTDVKEEVIKAIGHHYGKPEYTWAEDNSAVTAKRVCENDKSHVETETAKTSYTEKTKASCEQAGVGVYTAGFENKAFETQTKEVAIPATGHNYELTKWTWTGDETDGYTAAEALFTCKNDPSHTQTVKAELSDKAENGVKTYTASVTFEGKTYTDTKEVLLAIELDKHELVLKSDDDEKLTAVYVGTEETAKNAVWTTDNKDVLEVGADGKLIPRKAGWAVVTAEANGFTDSCEVMVLFDDVQDDSKYFYEPVYWATKNGVTTGVGNFYFAPTDVCTRGQFVTFLWRLKGEQKPEKEYGFTDVKPGKWYSDAVNWAACEGITTGYGGTMEFGVNNACTRADVVTFLWRAAGSPEPEKESTFKDVKSGKYYSKAVAWAAENKITTGISKNEFGVSTTCTRAMIVTFLYRFANLTSAD